jgi:glycosyltransferase involved in cell wall biosynthesis
MMSQGGIVMNAPLITIGLTCYNAEVSITKAIKSAVDQNYVNKEILVVDDCSTDSSKDLLRSLEAQHACIRVIFLRNNVGAAGARNELINQARGEYIAFFDDDDISLPNRLTSQLNKLVDMEAKTGIKNLLCFSSGVRIYPNGYQYPMPAIGSRGLAPLGPDALGYLLWNEKKPKIFYGAGTPTCALMAKVNTLQEVGGFDESLRRVEDLDLAVRVALSGGGFVGTTMVEFHQLATHADYKVPSKNLESELQIIEKYKTQLEATGRYWYAKTWLKFRYFYFAKRLGKAILTLALLLMRHPIITTSHLCFSAPSRILHEYKMAK